MIYAYNQMEASAKFGIMKLKQRNECDNDNDNDNQNMKEHGPGIQIQSRNINPAWFLSQKKQ